MTTPALSNATALERAGAVVSETALKLTDPRKLTWEEYEGVGEFLGALGRAYCWWVGDFLLYGEEIFGEEYAQIESTLPHSAQTLANYRSIAKHIPPSRRRARLSFSTHAEVAYLEPSERDRWLDEAVRNDWKRDEMRGARRAARLGLTTNTGVEVEPSENSRCPTCGRPYHEEES